MAKARKITRTRLVVGPGFAELVVWEVPEPVSGSQHNYKYRLAYVVNGVCRVRYDNETKEVMVDRVIQTLLADPISGLSKVEKNA